MDLYKIIKHHKQDLGNSIAVPKFTTGSNFHSTFSDKADRDWAKTGGSTKDV